MKSTFTMITLALAALTVSSTVAAKNAGVLLRRIAGKFQSSALYVGDQRGRQRRTGL